MEIFSLVAKLTLDKNEYERSLQEAESDARGVEDIEAQLSLDDHDFVSGVDEANDAEVNDLESTLDLDEQPFSEGVEQAKADGEVLEGTLGDIFENIKGLLVTAGIATAIGGIVSNLTEAVDLARSMGDNIDKSSRAMSLTTDAYQEWSHVMDINGASITDLNRGLMNMRKLMGGGEPSKEFAEGMDKLGLSARVANGEIKTTEELLDASLKALADYEGTDRDYITQALFGRSGTKLNAMFDGTSQDIEDLKQQAHDLGLVMSQDAVASAAAYNDAVTNMNASIDAFKVSLVEGVLPILTDIANTIATVVAFFNPRTRESGLSEQFAESNKELSKSLSTIEGTSGAAMELVDKLLSMGEAEKLTAEQQAEWKATADWLIKNIPSLSGVIDTDTLSINGNKDAITANINEWKRLATQRAVNQAKEEKQRAMMEKHADAIDKVAQARAKANDAIEKQNEMVAVANETLKNNSELAERFGAVFDTTTIDKNAENYQDMMDWLNEVGYEFGDTRALQDATESYNKIVNEQRTLKAEAESAQKQLDEAEREFELWSQAIDEMYGIMDEDAASATGSVDSLNDSLSKLPKRKQVYIDLLVSELSGLDLPPRARGDWKVPYDMPVLVHKDERILTASQTRAMDEGKMGGMDLSGMYNVVKSAIKAGMEDVSVNSYLNGREISDDVNRNAIRELKARRFKG